MEMAQDAREFYPHDKGLYFVWKRTFAPGSSRVTLLKEIGRREDHGNLLSGPVLFEESRERLYSNPSEVEPAAA